MTAREDVELLVLEGSQVLAANLGRLLHLDEFEALAQARLAKTVTDLEHGGRPIVGGPLSGCEFPQYVVSGH